MKRFGVALFAAGVAAACLVGFVTGDAAGGARRRRPPKVVVSDVRVGDGGVVVTTDAEPTVVVRFRLTARRRAYVAVRFELGMDRHSNGYGVDGYIDDTEFRRVSVDLDAPEGTSVPTTRGGSASSARFEASPKGIEHVAVWRARADIVRDRHLATLPGPAGARPDAFDLLPSTRPVFRITPRRGTAAARAFEYDGNAAPVLTLESVTPGAQRTLLSGRAFDADSEDLNGDGNLDPLDGEDRNGDGVLQEVPVTVTAWWVRVPERFDAGALSEGELLRLGWQRCTLAIDFGPVLQIVNIATPNGRQVTYRWKADTDVPGETGPFLLGMRIYDPQLSASDFEVFPTPVVRDAPR